MKIHTQKLKKRRFTLILVCVQKVLELGVEDLQVFLYEDLLTLPGQLVLGGFMEVNLHTPLLLQQTGLSLRKNTLKSHYYMDNTS